MDAPADLLLHPIGVVHSPFVDRMSAPRQPRAAAGVRATIELFPGHGFDRALRDVERWEYLWVLFWFHHNRGWRPMVLPPRSTHRRGLFATRTPHRPNPIGMSVVRLESVNGLVLHVRDIDMLDGTPVLDIKPYVAWCDALPDAGGGWLEDARPEDTPLADPADPDDPDDRAGPADPLPAWTVTFAPLAREQLDELMTSHAIDLTTPLTRNLSLGPQAHPYRRISRDPNGLRVAVKEWRARFEVDGRTITVTRIWSGYRLEALAGDDPALEPHRAFERRWGR